MNFKQFIAELFLGYDFSKYFLDKTKILTLFSHVFEVIQAGQPLLGVENVRCETKLLTVL